MSGVREGARVARALAHRNLSLRIASSCARGFASASEAKAPENEQLKDLESTTTFASPAPDQKAIDAFNQADRSNTKERRLPGNRYASYPDGN
jgi:large subunit ribosomal protein L5